ncbi:TolC family outer membrane protein [Propionivibrio sp.]|uniref:TolC family outer membrane protein n=1 Tax=Propionivibrio sp. TaxID=2212460 RepID=UPI0025F323B2|nr:TolC family outer membrane protein [Propionivibrio sp.]MBK7354929.1 TolC family outer membrane protein [Propionivibrio sp.]MBK8402298.1 TolC family outer membrane protein [Propionivibrio sp.]MBK8743456.1 TolC family outer membrane protein [Propionivibrio sp.]MBK8892759.1 TolC family outer membrane protein [Propionivibrio sp.]MBL0206587.1 TolC family outer membrane protein [Propionivibrio sp.]
MRLTPSVNRFIFLLGAIASVAPAFAADLLQIYRDALSNDQQYAAARATVDAGREKLPQGLAGLLPTIGATANTVWNENKYKPDNQPNVNRNFNTHAYNVSLTQPLFRWQNYVQYGQGKLQVVQAEANFAQATQDLVLRVAQAYFDVLYATDNLVAVRANKFSISRQLEQAKKNFEVGTATITDTHEAQSRFDLASAQEIAAESDLEVKRFALRVITGKNSGELNRLKPQAELKPPQPASMDKWVDAAERDSFIVQAQLAAAEVAAKEVERTRAGHLPTLDVVANYGKSNSALGLESSIGTDSRNIGLQLNIPIFQGGYVNSKTREAVANRSAADAALESAKRAAALNAQQSFLGVVNGLAQVRALEAALISSTSALESNKLGYEVGVRINIDVLNAENQVYVTKRDLAKARFDTLLSQLKLKAAVGSLGEDDLEQINPLFEAP